jgi:hypothetical protein
MSEALMFFARGADGAIVDVTQVPNGAASGCTCLGCKAPLLAKQGKVNAWHFGHATGGNHLGCAETALHLAGKDLLRSMTEIVVPSVAEEMTDIDVINREHSQSMEAQASTFVYSTCNLEHTVGLRRLDALLVSLEGSRFGIEIFVSNKVDALKAKDLVELNVPVLELDLRGWVGKPLDREALKVVLGKAAPRKVVAGRHCLLAHQVVIAKETLASRLADIARAVPRVLALTDEGTLEGKEIVERIGIPSSPWPTWLDWSGWLQGQPLERIPRQLFGVHHRVWQAACAAFLWTLPEGKKFSVDDVIEAVHQSLRAPLYNDSEPERAGLSEFLGKELVRQGRVRFCGNDDHGWGEDWYKVCRAAFRLSAVKPNIPSKFSSPKNDSQLNLF